MTAMRWVGHYDIAADAFHVYKTDKEPDGRISSAIIEFTKNEIRHIEIISEGRDVFTWQSPSLDELSEGSRAYWATM